MLFDRITFAFFGKDDPFWSHATAKQRPVCNKSDFKHSCSPSTDSGVLSHLPEFPHLYLGCPGVLHCILQATNSRNTWLGGQLLGSSFLWCLQSTCSSGNAWHPPCLRAQHFSTLVSPSQWKHTVLLWPDCSTFPLKGVWRAVAACQR